MRDKKKTALQTKLLAWYGKNARDLPWRRTKDPYAIWVSEIMLQQTQVDTVIPYYKRWLKRFPALASLAKVPVSEALKNWAGLGYYRRPRMLHEAARKLIKNDSGKIPCEVSELLKLPGIGRYTAGAIASIAFNRPVPILDGNVIRILARIFALKNDVGNPKTIKQLWEVSEFLVPQKNPGDFNQAMMELGATVCLPENPRCPTCPVASLCAAHAVAQETSFPVKTRSEKIIPKNTSALILRQENKILLHKQPRNNRWGGLWMFPFWENQKQMFRDLGLKPAELNRRINIQHSFTKYRIQLSVYEHSGMSLNKKTEKWAETLPGKRWTTLSELKNLGFPSPHQKIVRELTDAR